MWLCMCVAVYVCGCVCVVAVYVCDWLANVIVVIEVRLLVFR